MKRAVMFLAAGVLIFGSALSATAQAPAGPTVSFAGEFRFLGFVDDNLTDYKDTTGTSFKDSNSRYTQRLRLFTTIESADKNAKVVWALEIGDITLGNGGGANACEYGGPGQTAPGATTPVCPATGTSSARVGNNSGGGLGSDGINVETKHAYLWFKVPGVPNASLTAGIQNFEILSAPAPFFSDDAAGIKLDLKFDPADLQLFTFKASENLAQDADDNDFYGARFGIALTKDTRLTVEGLLVNGQCIARRPVTTTTGTSAPSTTPGTPVLSGTPTTATTLTGTCISHDVGDTYWVGATAKTMIGTIALEFQGVYGQRVLACPTCAAGSAEEKGWGVIGGARIPVGPVTVNASGWYTTGDDTRAPGVSASGPLTKDSDKLPLPEFQGSWWPKPLIAEALFGHNNYGGPGGSPSPFYAEPAGTYGIGASALYALTPALTIGGGGAYVGATDAAAIFGDNVIELDGGLFYRVNANVTLDAIAAYLLPDKGDDAWSLMYRLRYAF